MPTLLLRRSGSKVRPTSVTALYTQVVIVSGRSNDVEDAFADLRSPGRCGEATLGAVTSCTHCMPYENGRPLLVCRRPQFTFREIWPGEKRFI